MKFFDIYFSGQMLETANSEEVKRTIGERFKVTGSKLEKLFSGKAVLIKSGVDATTAGKYRETFRQAGALIDIVPSGQRPAEPKPDVAKPPRETPSGELKLMPLEASDLSDTARKTPELEIPDSEELSISPAGALFPDASAAPSPEIDTSHLEAAPANTGSLEEFADLPSPAPIPDISQLEAVAPDKGNLSDESEPVTATPVPDIDHLEATASSLEDCVEEKEETPIPDISEIKLGN